MKELNAFREFLSEDQINENVFTKMGIDISKFLMGKMMPYVEDHTGLVIDMVADLEEKEVDPSKIKETLKFFSSLDTHPNMAKKAKEIAAEKGIDLNEEVN